MTKKVSQQSNTFDVSSQDPSDVYSLDTSMYTAKAHRCIQPRPTDVYSQDPSMYTAKYP